MTEDGGEEVAQFGTGVHPEVGHEVCAGVPQCLKGLGLPVTAVLGEGEQDPPVLPVRLLADEAEELRHRLLLEPERESGFATQLLGVTTELGHPLDLGRDLRPIGDLRIRLSPPERQGP